MSQYTEQEIILKVARDENLAEANLSKFNLSRTNLFEAKLSGANLSEANLSGTNLSKADLSGTSLSKANLSGASLIEANFVVANLSEANLRHANLRKAELFVAILCKADLSEADLSEANLRGTDLSDAKLNEAELIGAKLIEAKLVRTDLRNTNLSSANCENADLSNADISGANIYHLNKHGWKIEGIKCTHVYQCNEQAWTKKEEREKYRRDFAPGAFEELFKTLPTIEMLFAGGISPQDYLRFLGMTKIIAQEHPGINPELKSMERVGLDTILRFTLSKDEHLETAVGLMAQLWKDKAIEQKLLPVLKEQGIQLTGETHYHITGCNVSITSTGGEVKHLGDIININGGITNSGNFALGSGANINEIEQPIEVEQLLTALRKALDREQQDLIDSLKQSLAAKNQTAASGILEKIKTAVAAGKDAVALGTTVYPVLEKLGVFVKGMF